MDRALLIAALFCFAGPSVCIIALPRSKSFQWNFLGPATHPRIIRNNNYLPSCSLSASVLAIIFPRPPLLVIMQMQGKTNCQSIFHNYVVIHLKKAAHSNWKAENRRATLTYMYECVPKFWPLFVLLELETQLGNWPTLFHFPSRGF